MRLPLLALALLIPFLLAAQGRTRTEVKVCRQLAKGKAYPAIRNATGMLVQGGHPEFFALRAEGYNAIGEHAKAAADARNAVRLLPGQADGLFQLALAEQGLGMPDSAVLHLRQLLVLAPTVEARFRLAEAERMRGKLNAAMEEIDRAIQQEGAGSTASARLHRVKGEIAAMAGDSAMARTQLDSAVALAPGDPVNYNSRGYYRYAWAGNHQEAIADYDRAIKLNPNYSYAFNNRGWSRYQLGDKKKAIRDINQAKRKKAHNPFVYRNLGVIYLESGDTAKACTNFRQALDNGFTARYGDEVEQRINASCGRMHAPVQPPKKAMRKPTEATKEQAAPRTNAPE